MLPGQCRPERCHGVREACLMHRNDIHVALAENQLPGARAAGDVVAVQIPALVEDSRFRTVEILRLCIAHHAAAESDHPILSVQNREDHSVAEAVIHPSPQLVQIHQPGQANQLIRKTASFQVIVQRRRISRRKAKPEALDCLISQLSSPQIRKPLPPVGAVKLLEEPCRRHLVELQDLHLLVAGFFLSRTVGLLRQTDPSLAGERLDRLLKGHVVVLLQEGKDISALMAAKAVVHLTIRIDTEGRRLFIMKRTQSDIPPSGLFQPDTGTDQAHNVRRVPDLVDHLIRIVQMFLPPFSFLQHCLRLADSLQIPCLCPVRFHLQDQPSCATL